MLSIPRLQEALFLVREVGAYYKRLIAYLVPDGTRLPRLQCSLKREGLLTVNPL